MRIKLKKNCIFRLESFEPNTNPFDNGITNQYGQKNMYEYHIYDQTIKVRQGNVLIKTHTVSSKPKFLLGHSNAKNGFLITNK